MLLKSDKPSYVQFIDESRTDWYFTVLSRDGEIGLITAHDSKTGEVIELGRRLKKCIFVRPEEYADLIEQLELARDELNEMDNERVKEYAKSSNGIAYAEGWKDALNIALQLVALKANPQPGIE